MLVTTKEMMLEAQRGHYAIGAFNVENLEFVMAVLAAAEERKSPVIMQTTPGTVKYASLESFHARVAAAAARTDGPDAGKENPFTDPDEAVEFVERTGCTSLAVGVGTAHGVYKGTPHIEQEILKEIRSKLDIPLVLHGTSGVPDDQVAEAIQNGICKVNYATELRQVFTKGFMEYMAENPGCFDPKKPAKVGMANITKIVGDHMDNLGSTGRA